MANPTSRLSAVPARAGRIASQSKPGAPSPGRLSVEHIGKSFAIDDRQIEALRDVSLTLESGEFGALIGPSGCGKSTLLRMVADIMAPDSGGITIGGMPPSQARKEHQIGFVFQDPTLLPWRTVLDNVRLPLELAGSRGTRSKTTPLELIELVGLAGFEQARPSELSGGMQQRCAIARALALSPQMLLLDEPFGALDEIIRYRMNLELLRIHAETGTTTLMVTHSIQEAVFMADKIFVLAAKPGRIIDLVTVDIARPRRLSDMNEPAFADAVTRVRNSLFGETPAHGA
jgi:NitT/TauT family transport system ATP-binding protein